jgi:hypothetical protein
MKIQNTFILSLIFTTFTFAQNVGIGTTNPTSKLHVVGNTLVDGTFTIFDDFATLNFRSGGSNKAFLQLRDPNFDLRLGTVGFNTTGKVFLQTNGTDRLTIDPGGNIGIGTVTPDEKLHVNGNFLGTGTLRAEGTLTAASSLIALGSTVLNGASYLQGDANFASAATAIFRGGMELNKVDGTFQLKANDVDKGFLQLNGDDLRLGTNSGNTLGKTVFRNDGVDIIEFKKNGTGSWLQLNNNGVSNGVLQVSSTGTLSLTNPVANELLQLGGEIWINGTANRVGIGISSPAERLHINGNELVTGNSTVNGNSTVVGNTSISGNLNVTGFVENKLTAANTGSNYHLLPVCYGRVAANGNKLGGTPNFTVSKPCINDSPGCYYITSPQITSSSIIIINVDSWLASSRSLVASFHFQGNNDMGVYISDEAGEPINSNFNFVIFDP